jgi:hypothetical protein
MPFQNRWKEKPQSTTNIALGQGAEFAIQHELKKLPPSFKIRCNHPSIYGVGDIDAIVVGPTGIFIIEIKGHKGKFIQRGNELHRLKRYHREHDVEKDFIRQCLNQRHSIEEILKDELHYSPLVQSIIVFPSPEARICIESGKIFDIHIIGKDALLPIICNPNSKVTLTKTLVEHISHIIQQSPFFEYKRGRDNRTSFENR